MHTAHHLHRVPAIIRGTLPCLLLTGCARTPQIMEQLVEVRYPLRRPARRETPWGWCTRCLGRHQGLTSQTRIPIQSQASPASTGIERTLEGNKKRPTHHCVSRSLSSRNSGRGDMIRTCDPLIPNQMRYQAALRPEPAIVLCLQHPGQTTLAPLRQTGSRHDDAVTAQCYNGLRNPLY